MSREKNFETYLKGKYENEGKEQNTASARAINRKGKNEDP